MKEIIYFGDDVFLHDFSDNIDIYHAKDPMRPLENARNAIKEAIENPIESKKLGELITNASEISICFDDISVPLPPMKKDVRALAAEVIVEKLTDIGVKKENIRFTCATGLHRKCTPRELKHMLGKKIYTAFKSQIYNNDVSKKDNHVSLGKLTTGEEIRMNKLAVEADLIIYLNITFTPLNGGWKSIIVGLGDFTTIIPHHSPEILKEGAFMDPANSRLHEMIWEMGRMIKDKLTIFTVEMVLNTRFYTGIFEKIYQPLKSPDSKVPLWRKIALRFLKFMPHTFKAFVRKRLKAGYELIGVFAGEIEKAHEKALSLLHEQLVVPIKHQYDVIIYGVPNVSPYNIGSSLNPLLLHALVSGYLYNMYIGKPPLKKEGLIIISNPANEKFDKKQHPSYYDFYENVLRQKPDIFNLKTIEQEYLHDKKYLKLYKENFAYHGTHAPIIYYWGVLGLLNVSKIIVAGAKNQKVITTLGYQATKNLDEAIKLAKKMKGNDCSMAYFCIPPIFIAKTE